VRLGAREAALLAALLRLEETAAGLLRAGQASGLDFHRFVRAASGWAVESLVFAAARADLPSPLRDGRAAKRAAVAQRQQPTGGRALTAEGFTPSATAPGKRTLLSMLEGTLAAEAALAAPLLSGTEVMALLDLPPGPGVGRWLETVGEARAEGIVTTPEEARAWLLKQRATEIEEEPGNDRGSNGADAH
jgi:hypothetical protein